MSISRESALYLKRILFAILDFSRASGLDQKAIDSAISEWMKTSDLRDEAFLKKASLALGCDVGKTFGLVLHRWHRERAFLDEDAKPKGIRVFGAFPSVEALIRAESSGAPARKIARSLVDSGLIKKRKNGLYYPTSRVATISKMHPIIVEHVCESLTRFLQTVRQNTSSTRGAPRLIERYTQVPDLPHSKLKEFRSFSQAHGTAFLADVDDWLEPRRVKRDSKAKGSGCAAGVHVIAYVSQPAPKRKKPTPRAKRA
jgi:hypothetical protein